MGGRGASSGDNTKVVSYQDMIVNNQNVVYTLSFDKNVTIFETRGVYESSQTVPYSKVDYNKINEAIVQVDYGFYDKRVKELKNNGYKIIEKTNTKGKNKTDRILLHIKRR